MAAPPARGIVSVTDHLPSTQESLAAIPSKHKKQTETMWQSEMWAQNCDSSTSPIMEPLGILWKVRRKTFTTLVSQGLDSQMHESDLELDRH